MPDHVPGLNPQGALPGTRATIILAVFALVAQMVWEARFLVEHGPVLVQQAGGNAMPTGIWRSSWWLAPLATCGNLVFMLNCVFRRQQMRYGQLILLLVLTFVLTVFAFESLPDIHAEVIG